MAASSLSVQGGAAVYQASAGETNRVVINWGGERPTFSDVPEIEDAMTIGPGCQDTYGDRTIIECPGAPLSATFIVRLGDGNDRAQIVGDEQRGHCAELYGEAGDDQLLSEEGSDLLDGGDGNDELQPDDIDDGDPAGAGDVVSGGPGIDKLQLVDSPQDQLAASLDGVANDGGPGEGDNYLPDLEDVQGARGASNAIVGTAGPNRIEIISDDRVTNSISGAGGDDTLLGGGGNDTIDGGEGNNTIVGGAFNDTLIGGPGVDALDGDGDTLYPGNDRIEARDGTPNRSTAASAPTPRSSTQTTPSQQTPAPSAKPSTAPPHPRQRHRRERACRRRRRSRPGRCDPAAGAWACASLAQPTHPRAAAAES